MRDAAVRWCARYEAVYYMPTAGTVYVEDGRRASVAVNTWRDDVDTEMAAWADLLPNGVVVPSALPLRERMEWVYHHALVKLGMSAGRPARAYQQLRAWLVSAGIRVVEVRAQGSNSLTRFHPPTDHDDIDALVIVDGDAAYSTDVHAQLMAARVHLEGMVQANLDMMVCPRGCEPLEV
jgi:hypothetical protein